MVFTLLLIQLYLNYLSFSSSAVTNIIGCIPFPLSPSLCNDLQARFNANDITVFVPLPKNFIFVILSNKVAGLSYSQINSASKDITNSGATILVGPYDGNIAVLSTVLQIPYFVFDENTSPIEGPFILDCAVHDSKIAEAVNALLISQRVTTLYVVSYSDLKTAAYLKGTAGQKVTLLNSANITTLDKSFNQIMYQGYTSFLLSLPDSYVTPFKPTPGDIFKVAGNEKLFPFPWLWIVPGMYFDQQQFVDYRDAPSRVITFSYSSKPNIIWTSNMVLQSLVANVINHYISGYPNFTHDIIASINAYTYQPKINNAIIQSVSFTRNVMNNIIYINDADPADDFYMRQIGYYNPILDPQLTIVSTSYGISLPVLRISYIPYGQEPYYFPESVEARGFVVDIIKQVNLYALAKVVYVPVVSADPSQPATIQDMINDVVNGKADLIFTPLQFNSINSSLVQITAYFQLMGISMLVKKNVNRVDYLYLLEPFSFTIWSLIAIGYIALSICFVIITRISKNKGATHVAGLSVSDCFYFVFSSLFMARQSVKPTWYSARFFMVVVWFISLMLVCCYAASMINMFVTIPSSITFTDFKSLYAQRAMYTWSYYSGSTILDVIKQQQFSEYPGSQLHYTMYQYALANWPNDLLISNISEAVMIPNRVIINDDLINQYLAINDCTLKSVGNPQLLTATGITVRTNWPFADALNNIFNGNLNLYNNITVIRVNWTSLTYCEELEISSVAVANPLTLTNMSSVLYFLAGSIVLSFLIAILELILFKCSLLCQRLRIPKILFGEIYKAKVTTILQEGIYVQLKEDPNNTFFVAKEELHDTTRDYTAMQLGITIGMRIPLKYLGNNPVTGAKMFHKVDFEELLKNKKNKLSKKKTKEEDDEKD